MAATTRLRVGFCRPSLGSEELEAVGEVLSSGWLTTGAKASELEAEVAALVGCRHAVAVSSGTAALHLALEAAGVSSGDEVVVPSMTFAATAAVVHHVGARPIFVDTERETLTLDPEDFARKVGNSTRAVIPVHYAGHPCDMDAIRHIAGQADIRVIEDAAHALPSRYRSRSIGSIGDATAFSFYATKNLTTGEGGMLCTDHERWATQARMMSLHGIGRRTWEREGDDDAWAYEVEAPGYKYNLPDLLATIGVVQIRKLHAMQERRRALVSRYLEAFAGLEPLECPVARPEVDHAWHLFVARLRLECLTISRDRFIKELKERGIGVGVHFIPLHVHRYYRDTYGYQATDFPVAWEEYQRILSLPLYPSMSDQDSAAVVEAVWDVSSRFKR